MEIETVQVTLDNRIEYLKQIEKNKEANKESFPWMFVIISLIAGAGICLGVIHYYQKKKEKQIAGL
jgi:phosphotransferase system  glucose/maltose/N-acetylglucosamine-specific IIC component